MMSSALPKHWPAECAAVEVPVTEGAQASPTAHEMAGSAGAAVLLQPSTHGDHVNLVAALPMDTM